MVALEIYWLKKDLTKGPITRVPLKDGKLVSPDAGTEGIIKGQRLRHPGLDDSALVDACDGWSNGYLRIDKAE